jgi:hypothetical protein
MVLFVSCQFKRWWGLALATYCHSLGCSWSGVVKIPPWERERERKKESNGNIYRDN